MNWNNLKEVEVELTGYDRDFLQKKPGKDETLW